MIGEIAEELGYHPTTISGWLGAGGPPPARESDRSLFLIDEQWGAKIAQLLDQPEAVGHQYLRCHLGGRVRGLLSDGVSQRPSCSRPAL